MRRDVYTRRLGGWQAPMRGERTMAPWRGNIVVVLQAASCGGPSLVSGLTSAAGARGGEAGRVAFAGQELGTEGARSGPTPPYNSIV